MTRLDRHGMLPAEKVDSVDGTTPLLRELKTPASHPNSLSNLSSYLETVSTRNGRDVEIRAISRDDRDGLLAALRRTSNRSLFRRFFTVKRHFTEEEIEFYVNVDFVSHVALVAVMHEGGDPMIIGGARYIVLRPGEAEVAFAVDDTHQGQGVGSALMQHLALIARHAGLHRLTTDVLSENASMVKVLESTGARITKVRDHGVLHVTCEFT